MPTHRSHQRRLAQLKSDAVRRALQRFADSFQSNPKITAHERLLMCTDLMDAVATYELDSIELMTGHYCELGLRWEMDLPADPHDWFNNTRTQTRCMKGATIERFRHEIVDHIVDTLRWPFAGGVLGLLFCALAVRFDLVPWLAIYAAIAGALLPVGWRFWRQHRGAVTLPPRGLPPTPPRHAGRIRNIRTAP